jgi:hypothetical protein
MPETVDTTLFLATRGLILYALTAVKWVLNFGEGTFPWLNLFHNSATELAHSE